MKLKMLLLFVILWPTLVGCTPNSSLTASPTIEGTALLSGEDTPLASLPPTLTISATPTLRETIKNNPQLSTAVPTLAQSFTPTPPIPELEQPVRCTSLQTPASLGENPGIQGVIGFVLINGTVSNDSSLTLMGAQPLKTQELLPLSTTRPLGFSPDGEWLAYQVTDSQTDSWPQLLLHLLSVDGELLTTAIPLRAEETSGRWFGGWLSNEQMLIMYEMTDEDNAILSWRYTVVNPFTGERRDDLLANLPHWNQETAVYFSPDMSRLVYAGRSSTGSVLVLWDVEAEEILWEVPFISDLRFDERGLGAMSGFGKIATWSPDGSQFLFTTAEREGDHYFSYLIDRNGMQETIVFSSTDSEDNLLYHGVWSPNQRYFAYIRSNSILLYDFAANRIIELCPALPPFIFDLVWSPDSNNLVFLAQAREGFYLASLNIYTGVVSSIMEVANFFPGGWLENEKWLAPKLK